MANKTREWTTEELQRYRLADVSPRCLAQKETVEVRCAACDCVFSVKFVYLQVALNHRGKHWCCKDCNLSANSERGKLLTSKNNPFYGKSHSKETREKMKVSSRKRWDAVSEDERNAIGLSIRRYAEEKFGGNPMLNPDVRASYSQKANEFWEDEERVKSWSHNKAETCMAKYGTEHYVSSEEWMARKEQMQLFTSKAETDLLVWLADHGIEAKKRRKDHVEIDVFVEHKNIGIEMNGLYWHSEKFVSNDYHYNKYLYCKENGIHLIQVFSHEWATRKEQVLSRIASLLGITEHKIGARECSIQEVPLEAAKPFFFSNHIQGFSDRTSKVIGLFYADVLVAAASFGRHHRNNKEMVLTRFCSLSGWQVVGALSRISKAASSALKEDLVTWCDLRWSLGRSYESAGWQQDGVISPDYFYIKNGNKVIPKQSRRKAVVNTPKDMTEHQHALSEGLLRVYDCGKIRFIYKYIPTDKK